MELSTEQTRALEDAIASRAVDERTLELAGVLGLAPARRALGGDWLSIAPGELERYVLEHALSLPPTHAECEVVEIGISGKRRSIYRGPSNGIPTALFSDAAPGSAADWEDFYENGTKPPLIKASNFYSALETAEENGTTVRYSASHPLADAWREFRADVEEIKGGDKRLAALLAGDAARCVVAWSWHGHDGEHLSTHAVLLSAGC